MHCTNHQDGLYIYFNRVERTPLERTVAVRSTVTGQLANTPTCRLPTRGLDISWTGQLADWTTRGLADAAKKEN